MAKQITHMSVKEENGCKHLTINEWFQKPMSERIKMILGNKVQFFNGDEVVPSREAVRLLKTIRY